MANNADCVSDLLQFLSGRETVGFIRERFFVVHAAN